MSIQHVVYLMLENQSFDRILGGFPIANGVQAQPGTNKMADGTVIPQAFAEITHDQIMPNHEFADVMEQMDGGKFDKFVHNFQTSTPKPASAECQQVMAYFKIGALPALHKLASEFTLCDHWFSSLPGPTWPNRFFALSGTSSGIVTMPSSEHLDLSTITSQTQTTVFDALNTQGVDWKVYYHDFPSSLLLRNQRDFKNLVRYHHMDDFYQDVAGGHKTFPKFSFIEPRYFGVGQNDGHPPHDLLKTDQLVADLYNALRGNQEIWESLLFIINFDEHGGFYDHLVPPVPAASPDGKLSRGGFDFKQYGVRVPALLVSPWAQAQVSGNIFDHTSVLKFCAGNWGFDPRSLGNRTAAAEDLKVALGDTLRDDTLTRIFSSTPTFAPANAAMANGHHDAIAAAGPTLAGEIFQAIQTARAADPLLDMAGKHRAEDVLRSVMDYGNVPEDLSSFA